MVIRKKIVYDEKGNPTDVLISWGDFKKIEETLGFDFENEVKKHLIKVKEESEANDYKSLEEL